MIKAMESDSLLEYFRARQPAFLDLMKRLVAMETVSGDARRINLFLDFLERLFQPFAPQRHRIGGNNGDMLILSLNPRKKPLRVLLAHVDTTPTAVNECRLRGRYLHGTGAYDMKNAIALFYFALRAIHDRKLVVPCQLKIILTSDEETGSSASLPRLMRICRRARAVLLPEPSGPAGEAKVMRKATAHIRFALAGRAVHSGLEPERGCDANRALAELIFRLDELISRYRDMTFNPGLIAGGKAVNVVAPASQLQGEIRSFSTVHVRRAMRDMRKISVIAGAQVHFSGRIAHPALEFTAANRRLYRQAEKIMRALGCRLGRCASGGASDGSFLSAAGIPVLDGIGMRGRGAHSAREAIDVMDFPHRAALLTRLILERP